MADFSSPTDQGGRLLQAPDLNFAGGQVMAFTTATASAPITARAVMIASTANCWVTAGAAPVASIAAGSFYLPAGVILFLAINSGWRISVLQDSTGGNMSIMPCLYPA